MPRFICSLLAALAFTLPAAAQEPIRFARTPDVSPDGKALAFSYHGDIYTVETIGGTARAVTSHAAHDINPVFSPDGRHLAFSSNRHGSYDVFVVSARGGKPTRLTFDSAPDMVCGWSPDGKNVLFASARTTDYPGGYELFTVPTDGGRARRVVAADGKEGAYSPKGDLLAYTRGPGSWWRKNYRGSSNDDIWVCNADGSNHRRLTTFEGQDHSPMWSADGTALYYVSEAHGVANIVRQPAAATSASAKADAKPAQVTFHTDESVRRARISRDGGYIVYECGADLYCVCTKPGSKPRKIAIEVNADDKSNNERVITFTRGATEYGLSGDERFAVFAVHGKLFRQQVGPNHKAVQMTVGPSNDHGAVWAPDSSKIIFVSDRDGREDLYLLEHDDPDHPKLTDAHRFKVTRLTDTKEPESGVSFSPDGKRVGFIRAGKLWTMSPNGKDAKVLVDGVTVFDYEWSPDGKWVVYARRDGSFASELYLIPVGGATKDNPVRNITRYATFNAGVTWSADGKKLAFLTDRRGVGNLYALDLEKEAAKTTPALRPPMIFSWAWGGKPALTIDFEDIHRRAKPVLRGTAEEAAISPDGTKIAFRDTNSRDLWIVTSNGDQLTRVTTGGVAPRQIVWSKGPSRPGTIELLYFLDGSGNIRLCNAAGSVPSTTADGQVAPAGGTAAAAPRTLTMPFKVKMTVKMDEMYQEMFDQGWRYLAEHFYDEKHHGRDWADVGKRYRPLVKHVSMREDLYALMYLMMGELNASHLGVQGFAQGPEEDTADLGLIFDEGHKGKGLKIGEVLKRGPADKKGVTLKAGEYVVAIDGTELDDKANLSKLLNGKAGEAVILLVTDKPEDPKQKPRRVELTAIGRQRSLASPSASATELMYDRWVAKNAARVSELSKGKLGYIHIPSMDEVGLDRFVRSLYSDNYDKDAIVLDVRFNGGGYTHDQVLNYLGGREHAIFRNRDGGEGLVLRSWDRKWHKPLTLLINNRSFSDAEIFPNAFRTLGLGKLVGQPTGGFVIGTSAVRLIDGSIFRVPQIGVWTTQGVNMDKEGVKPDVLVENRPDELAKGVDEQLDKAVAVLQGDVVAWQKKRNGKVALRSPGEGTKATSVPPLPPAPKPMVPMGTSK